jgi:hypothetical protein
MGYRSYGNLVFPAQFLPVFWEMVYAPKFAKTPLIMRALKNIKEVLQEWDDVVVWKDQEGVDMVGLSYSGWKWISSFPDISRLDNFMITLDGYLDSTSSKMFSLTEDIPEGVVTKLMQDYQAINVFQFGKVAARWDWGWNRQGEDTEDYEQIGHSDTLWNESEINWGEFEPIVSGEAWVFGMRVNEIEKKRMQAILDQKIKIPFEGVEAVFKTFGDENIYFFLYGQNQRMPPVVDLKYWFANYFGNMEVNNKDENGEIVRAEAYEYRGSYVVEGDNHWDWDVYSESYPSFEYYGKELDLDEVLQSYMKVAKEE